ncbi:low molecular weight protein tyrosine phosphatase family protein [Synoicihabitans lomoniglobus]|uniref:Protein tyrosine phosphatase n=1 Tax=Synoicihabitans lomoniglobus TaxID=2909285 RepID=A0AAE9ZWZ4_9BACT|nr:protein tyrosine phosphatase [Opitutaceae bacterium LMO-M01]WED64420.1 protein tyrosine phosphatase [Opitutaceae bacterium LMO-M01]
MEPLHLLFICSKNQWRSTTAEKIYREHPQIKTRSAGTSAKARHTVSTADIQWADLILVMERKHIQRLRASFPAAVKFKDLRVLEIEDRYRFMDPQLVIEIQSAVDPILTEALSNRTDFLEG